MTVIMEDLLTRTQLAQKLHISEQQIVRWEKAGIIPRMKMGHRTVRYRYEAVIRALESRFAVPQVIREEC